VYQAALSDLDLAARCHYEATHGDASSPEAAAWSYIEAHRAIAMIGLVDGFSGVK
jgi:hypothetical protein